MKVDDATSRADRGARALPDPERDRSPALDLGRGRARGARGRPRPAHPVARRAAPRRRTRTPRPGSRRSATRTPASTGSRPTSRRTPPSSSERGVGGAADALRRRAHPAGDRRRLGVSQMQVSRISRRALWKLLAAVRGEQDQGPVPASAERATDGRRTSERPGGARRFVRPASRSRAPPRPRRGCRTGRRPGRSRSARAAGGRRRPGSRPRSGGPPRTAAASPRPAG